jgi:hypothetical protein
MPGIFRLNRENTIVLTPEAKDLCPILSKLNNENFLYVILVYDTLDSPYRNMPLDDRKRIGRNRIWGSESLIPEEFSQIQDAITEMRSICYDPYQENRDILLQKLSLLNNDLLGATTASIKPILDAIRTVEERIEEIDEKMEKEIDMITLRGGKVLSFVEMFIRNRDKFTEKMKSYGIGNG